MRLNFIKSPSMGILGRLLALIALLVSQPTHHLLNPQLPQSLNPQHN